MDHVSLQDFGEFFLNDLESMEYATSIDDILLPITPRFLYLLGLFVSTFHMDILDKNDL